MKPSDDEIKGALIEMFKRVGFDYTWEQILAHAKADPNWYQTTTWTEAEDQDFAAWLYDHFKSYHRVEQLVGEFRLMWGWKVERSNQ